jgi:hypothetical protein
MNLHVPNQPAQRPLDYKPSCAPVLNEKSHALHDWKQLQKSLLERAALHE